MQAPFTNEMDSDEFDDSEQSLEASYKSPSTEVALVPTCATTTSLVNELDNEYEEITPSTSFHEEITPSTSFHEATKNTPRKRRAGAKAGKPSVLPQSIDEFYALKRDTLIKREQREAQKEKRTAAKEELEMEVMQNKLKMQKIEQVKELVASGLAQTANEALAMIENNSI